MNSLFALFNESFPEFQYYSLLQSLKQNEENEQTRLFKDIVRQRDEILAEMEKYKMLHDSEAKTSIENETSKKAG